MAITVWARGALEPLLELVAAALHDGDPAADGPTPLRATPLSPTPVR